VQISRRKIQGETVEFRLADSDKTFEVKISPGIISAFKKVSHKEKKQIARSCELLAMTALSKVAARQGKSNAWVKQ